MPATCVVVAGSTDLHGVVDPQTLAVEGVTVRHGGLSTLSGYFGALRQRFGRKLLLVDGGDIYQGTLVAKVSKGAAIIAAYNLMGYRAAALGNHEFDYGGEDGDPDVNSVLKARIRQARFPFLAANVIDRESGRRPSWQNLEASEIIDVGGTPVGVIGVITPEAPQVTTPQLVAGLDFLDPVAVVTSEARRLRADGVMLVVLLAHLGGKCAKVDDPDDLSSCDPDSELHRLLTSLPKGTVDVAFGGHTHSKVAHWVNGAAAIQPLAQGRQLGYVEACLKPAGGIDRQASTLHAPVSLCLDEWEDGGCGPRPHAARVVPAKFLGTEIHPQAEVEAALAPYRAQVHDLAAKPIGVRLPRPLTREGDGPSLGDLVARAMAESAAVPLAVQNRGGVRDDLKAGELTFGDAFQVLPFENRLVVYDLTGEEVRELVELLVERRDGLPPFVAGLAVRGSPAEPQVTLADGAPLEDLRTYRLVTNDYLGMGGEGAGRIFNKADKDGRRLLDQSVLDAFIDYLTRHFPSPPEAAPRRRASH
ncbi:MAG: bifunctional metallophosphatase/5'-nucleotidase [Deltaproteobacteria bacterium]|nr:bifunctional metallophosphatase/5'-nucleotidase [Deltaproteobacteria bacterium]